MADPTTLTGVGIWALAEGVKFLFSEAGEALKIWREHKAGRLKTARERDAVAPQPVPPAGAFEGTVQNLDPRPEVVEQVEEPLKKARADVLELSDGTEEVDPANPEHLAKIDRIRTLMEAVLEHRLTFKGENRPPSGPLARGEVNVKELLGEAAGISVGHLRTGTVEGKASADRVAEGGKLYGAKIDRID